MLRHHRALAFALARARGELLRRRRAALALRQPEDRRARTPWRRRRASTPCCSISARRDACPAAALRPVSGQREGTRRAGRSASCATASSPGASIYGIEQGNRELLEFLGSDRAHQQRHPNFKTRTIADVSRRGAGAALAACRVRSPPPIRSRRPPSTRPPSSASTPIMYSVPAASTRSETLTLVGGRPRRAPARRAGGRRRAPPLLGPRPDDRAARAPGRDRASQTRRRHVERTRPAARRRSRHRHAPRALGRGGTQRRPAWSRRRASCSTCTAPTSFAEAVAETVERGTHDPGELGVLCEKHRRAGEAPVPIDLGSAPTSPTATSSRTTSRATMPSDDVAASCSSSASGCPRVAAKPSRATPRAERLSPLRCASSSSSWSGASARRAISPRAHGWPCSANSSTLDRFDWNHPRKIDRELYERLSTTLDFIERGDNVLLRGPSGVGKTTLAQNLGLSALTHGYTVRFSTLAGMLADLLRRESLPALERRLRRYVAPEALDPRRDWLPAVRQPSRRPLLQHRQPPARGAVHRHHHEPAVSAVGRPSFPAPPASRRSSTASSSTATSSTSTPTPGARKPP